MIIEINKLELALLVQAASYSRLLVKDFTIDEQHVLKQIADKLNQRLLEVSDGDEKRNGSGGVAFVR